MMFTYMIYKSKQHACFQLSALNIRIYTLRKRTRNEKIKSINIGLLFWSSSQYSAVM